MGILSNCPPWCTEDHTTEANPEIPSHCGPLVELHGFDGGTVRVFVTSDDESGAYVTVDANAGLSIVQLEEAVRILERARRTLVTGGSR